MKVCVVILILFVSNLQKVPTDYASPVLVNHSSFLSKPCPMPILIFVEKDLRLKVCCSNCSCFGDSSVQRGGWHGGILLVDRPNFVLDSWIVTSDSGAY